MTAVPLAEDLYKDSVWVHTQNGVFMLDHPSFDIHDIAHALSLNCRFNGHINHFFSVAQHSLLTATIMEILGEGDPFEGLLHDATEAYMSDVPAPFKSRLPDWTAIDQKLELAMRQHFGLPEKKTEACKKADWYSLFIEAYVLLPSGGVGFHDPLGFRDEAIDLLLKYRQLCPTALPPKEVSRHFLATYHTLAP